MNETQLGASFPAFLLAVLFPYSSSLQAPKFEAVDPSLRVDCAPDPNVFQDVCEKRGCSWSPVDLPDKTIPWCHYPRNTGYTTAIKTKTGFRLVKAKDSPGNPFGGDTLDLNFDQYRLGDGVRLMIGADGSFSPNIPLNKNANIQSTEKLVVTTTTNKDIFSFTVERKSNGVRLWDTSIGGMLFGEQYIQLATLIPTSKIYGFGEHIHWNIQHDLKRYTTWPMFARDQPPDAVNFNTMNLYGVHNFYLGLEDDGKAHGVFVLNSNAQEVTTGPGPHLIYRAIGGNYEIFFFPGPTPEDVIRQYQQVIGAPYLPSYWALGYQLCKYGFKSLQDLKDTVQRINDAKIPFDTIMADIDYMQRYKDFTIDQEKWADFSNYAKKLKASGMHLTIMLDPAIEVDYDAFERAIDQNANFISWPKGSLIPRDIQDQYPLAKGTMFMLGVVWADFHMAFPDFHDDTNATQKWWSSEIKRMHDQVAFDGIWIDMNEPSNFGTNKDHPWYYDNPDHPKDLPLFCPTSGADSKYDFPPYHTQAAYQFGGYSGLLCDNTVCMLGLVNRGKDVIYNVKNLYGLMETIATQQALYEATGKRGQLITRSTFPSSGRYGGHWLGDNNARWEHLRSAIIGAQEFNLFGIPHVGSDVCGFIGETNEELCLRWHQLGAWHSFYRNHNDIKSSPQDPARWPSVAEATRIANLNRYRHLPYLYSLHFAASKQGGTVLRPVFFEFPHDIQTHDLSYQFMWGPAILVVPVIYPGVLEVDAYLPVEADWYQLYGDDYGTAAKVGRGIYKAPWASSSPSFVRGGYIIPRQEPSLTTMGTHDNEFQLLVTLNNRQSPKNYAFGEMYWDDGESAIDPSESFDNFQHYHFTFNYTSTERQAELLIQMVNKPKKTLFLPSIDEVEILGYPSAVSFKDAKVNGKDAKLSLQDSSYDAGEKILRLRRPETGFIMLNDHLDSWTMTWPNV